MARFEASGRTGVLRPFDISAACLLLVFLALSPSFAKADCECGYKIDDSTYENVLAVNDWSQIDPATHPDFSISVGTSATSAAGPGIVNEKRNVYSALGALDLIVRGAYDGVKFNVSAIPSAEIMTSRADMLYGSFRAEMKATWVSGTVATFGVTTEEKKDEGVEVELYSAGPRYVRFAHKPEIENDFPETHYIQSLESDSYERFFIYRFDWKPTGTRFFVDNTTSTTLTTNLPTTNGRVVMSHWSSGDPYLVRGPPEQDAELEIGSLHLFFNSSNPDLRSAFANRCATTTSSKRTCDLAFVKKKVSITSLNDAAAAARGWVANVGDTPSSDLQKMILVKSDGTSALLVAEGYHVTPAGMIAVISLIALVCCVLVGVGVWRASVYYYSRQQKREPEGDEIALKDTAAPQPRSSLDLQQLNPDLNGNLPEFSTVPLDPPVKLNINTSLSAPSGLTSPTKRWSPEKKKGVEGWEPRRSPRFSDESRRAGGMVTP